MSDIKKNVLVLGSGGREHAIAWSLSRSSRIGNLFIAPGNPGSAKCGKNISLNISDFPAIAEFAKQENIDLVVVGPEQPLVDGIFDFLEEKEIKAFGPSAWAARLEGSKSFAKEIMDKYGVPTAAYRAFAASDLEEAERYIRTISTFPLVIKADGLAAGKGVYIPESREDAIRILFELRQIPGISEAASTIVIEEFMEGEEASVFAICDGKNYITLSPAQDHKRIGDGDTGPNTGGMGAYVPAPLVTGFHMETIKKQIIEPVLDGMQKEGHPYKGVLYVGLMINGNSCKVVEFNCRFGDPECQVLLPALKTDLLEILEASVDGNLDTVHAEFHDLSVACVILASEGYPGNYLKNKVISGADLDHENLVIFHAGTGLDNLGHLITKGGRVMAVTAWDKSLQKAINNAYEGVSHVHFDGVSFRRDIGKKGLARLS